MIVLLMSVDTITLVLCTHEESHININSSSLLCGSHLHHTSTHRQLSWLQIKQTSQAAGSAKRSSSALTPEKVIGRIPRLDPLHKFKRYTGGFNVTNVHYWSVGPSTTTTPSVAFTGIWAYTMAIVCLLCGVLLLVWQTYTSNDTSFKEEVLLPESKAGHRVPVCCILQFGVLVLSASHPFLCSTSLLSQLLHRSPFIMKITV
ncbi:unnamed protein product [Sphagnum troendelagicum]